MEVEGNQSTGKTSTDEQTTGGADRQTFFYHCFGVVGG